MASIISAGTSAGTALNLTGDTSGALALQTNNGTTALTINASQQVGISVIPDSTWAIGTGVLQIGSSNPTSGGYLSNLSTGGFIALTQNLINIGGAYKYSGSSTGSLFYTQGGDYYWQSAPSGTAGATATLTTRMSLSQAGVLDVPNRGISKGSMPAGTVLQTVSSAFTSAFSTTATTDTATGLNVSITPTSATSKILVIVTANCRATALGSGNCYFYPTVYRNTATLVWTGFAQGGNFNSADFRGVASCCFLDSPATTSSTNYLFALNAVYAPSGVMLNNGGGTSVITLMEIAQ